MGGHYFITINNGTKNSPKMNMKEILGLCKTITGGGDPKSINLSQVLCTSIYCLRLFRSYFWVGEIRCNFYFWEVGQCFSGQRVNPCNILFGISCNKNWVTCILFCYLHIF